MVLAHLLRQKYLEPLRDKNREKFREEGRQRAHRKWKEWNNRRLEAQAAGIPFDEPHPGQEKSDQR